jgi:hypothetical protein
MPTSPPEPAPRSRLDKEVERERHQRELNDAARSGATSAAGDERVKDARETSDARKIRR